MGRFWRRSDIWWGKGSNAGHLKGRLASAKKSTPVDFRYQIGVYVLFDNFKITYVGQAGNGNAVLFDRLKSHHTGELSDRWDRFSWFGIKSVEKGMVSAEAPGRVNTEAKSILDHLEGILIAVTEPPMNKQSGNLRLVHQFSQYRDQENLGLDEKEMLLTIYNKIIE